jgi:hypothetical protein
MNLQTKKNDLIAKLSTMVYPTSQIFHKEITVEDYVSSIAGFFAKEMFDRRMQLEALPLFAELAMVLHELGEWEY